MKTLVVGEMGTGKTKLIKTVLIPELGTDEFHLIDYHYEYREFERQRILFENNDQRHMKQKTKSILSKNERIPVVLDDYNYLFYSDSEIEFIKTVDKPLIISMQSMPCLEIASLFDSIYVFDYQAISHNLRKCIIEMLLHKGKKVIEMKPKPFEQK